MSSADLEKKYKEEVRPKMKEVFKYPNLMAVPRIEKVVINAGFGKLRAAPQFQEKVLPEVTATLALITGQKPSGRPSKKSIAGFKVRQGELVGAKVTLRGKRMYDFLSRLINAVFPRVRDFRGVSEKKIDSSGNLTIGIKECSVFPEINLDTLKFGFGLEVTLAVGGVRKREEAVEFYRLMGIPLVK